MIDSVKSAIFDEDNKILLRTLVVESSDNELGFLPDDTENDFDFTFEQLIYLDRKVVVNVYDNTGGIIIYSGVVNYVLGDKFYVGNLVHLETIQRRKDLKILVNFKGIVTCTSTIPPKDFQVEFKDISAGGVRFEYPDQMDLGGEYEMVFTKGTRPVIIPFKILHQMLTKLNVYTCGCQFQNISPVAEKTVREYVFKSQRRIRLDED